MIRTWLHPNLWLGATLIVLTAGLSSSRGQLTTDEAELRAAGQRGQGFRQQGRYAEAILHLERAAQLATRLYGPDDQKTADTLNDLGIAYVEQGSHAKAEAIYQRCLQIYEATLGGNHSHVANTLNNLAILYFGQGQYANAEPVYRRSIEIHEIRSGKDSIPVADGLNNLGNVYQAQGQYAKAEAAHRRSLAIREAKLGRDHVDVAQSLHNLASLDYLQARYDQAKAKYGRSLRIRQESLGSKHPLVAQSLQNLGVVAVSQGDYTEAEVLYQRCLQIREARLGREHPDVAAVLNNLADVYWKQGELQLAEPVLQRALAIREAGGKDHPDVGATLGILGNLYSALGEFAKAEQCYLRGVQVQEAALGKDHADVAFGLLGLGALYLSVGQSDKAESFYRRGLKIWEGRLGPNHPWVARPLQSLANLCRAKARYAEAGPLYQRSLRIREAALGVDHPEVATAVIDLASLHRLQGQYAEAEPLYRRGLKVLEAKFGEEHLEVAWGLVDLGMLFQAKGRHAEALPLFRRALRTCETGLGKDSTHVASTLTVRGQVHAALEQWHDATEDFERARRIMRRHASQVLPALTETEQLTFLHGWDALAGASLSLALQCREDGEITARSATWVLNGKGLTQQTLAESSLLAREATDPKTRDVVRDLLAVRKQLAGLSFARPAADQEDVRRKQIARLRENEQSLVRQLGQAGSSLRDDPWVDLNTIRRAIPRNAVLIELARVFVFNFRTGRTQRSWETPHYAAWVIPPAGQGEVRLLDLGPAEKIEAAVAEVRRGFQAAQSIRATDNPIRKLGERAAEEELRKPLTALATLVLQPLLEHVGSSSHLLLSPDAALWLVPWAALPLDATSYAVEKYQLSYVVSGRDLVQPAATVKAGRPRVLADPDFDISPEVARSETERLVGRGGAALPSSGLPHAVRLPGTAAEAEALRAGLERYAGEAPWIYRQKQALEGVCMKFHSPRVLVLCTHGFFLDDQQAAPSDYQTLSDEKRLTATKDGRPLENPLLRCGLLLAGCNRRGEAASGGEDGVLTGLEIVGLDLRGCELVVLSACDTGLGQVRNGEGVAGLRQAFQLAGARNVVSTLWQIPDDDTVPLMTAFFDGLAARKSHSEALRSAQLELLQARRARKGAAHPFFWAAFTLTGPAR